MIERHRQKHRLERQIVPSVQPWRSNLPRLKSKRGKNAVVDCGWGRLIFAQTFGHNQQIADTLQQEERGKRDIAWYLSDPHVVISLAPQGVFLDPSHTFRLWLDRYRPSKRRPRGFSVRFMTSRQDAQDIHDLYLRLHMVPPKPDFLWQQRTSRELTHLVAVSSADNRVIGAVLGVDHDEVFDDPENGSSLWALAVDPQAQIPGVGEALVRQLAEHYLARGRSYMDLSVMHDNGAAIGLYEKLGFVRIPVFALKRKNPFNEPLYIADVPEDRLNPYATILVREARRRGIGVEVLDEESNYFALAFGGRTIVCRESLTELTTAIAMSRCDDKAVTHRILAKAGLRVPAQARAGDETVERSFLGRHQRVVVKPARGEQGMGISVDIRNWDDLQTAIAAARRHCDQVLLEEFVQGQDLRIVLIDFKVVAAAIRRPAAVVGTGEHTIASLIEKQSRRRAAATGGESRIPLDAETQRCVREAGLELDQILPQGQELIVRKTANLHTGGTIHDVTERLHARLCDAAVRSARALNIPVVGLDLLVPSVTGPEYVIIEANERPGLANHEPQPTAERFIDFLFPQTARRNG